jgi:hypothetical protein
MVMAAIPKIVPIMMMAWCLFIFTLPLLDFQCPVAGLYETFPIAQIMSINKTPPPTTDPNNISTIHFIFSLFSVDNMAAFLLQKSFVGMSQTCKRVQMILHESFVNCLLQERLDLEAAFNHAYILGHHLDFYYQERPDQLHTSCQFCAFALFIYRNAEHPDCRNFFHTTVLHQLVPYLYEMEEASAAAPPPRKRKMTRSDQLTIKDSEKMWKRWCGDDCVAE